MSDGFTGETGQNFGTAAPVAPVASQTQSEEKLLRQSEVNELIGRAKNEAVERYKRETHISSHEQPSTVQPQYAQPAQQSSYIPPYQPQPRQLTEDDYRRIAAEEAKRSHDTAKQEARREADMEKAQRTVGEFLGKVDAGKSKYQDWDTVVKQDVFQRIPTHVELATRMENTADVMYELFKNPMKIAQLQTLIDLDIKYGREPILALQEMQRLSDSIKRNDQASKFESPREPLDQLRPGNAGTDNAGARSVRDYKQNPKYRV